ncbi:MAG: diacylglycerol kinase [Planctomycetota bacterium]
MTAWIKKFGNALAGCRWAFRTQSSFWVHVTVSVLVISVSIWLGLTPVQWSVITLCIGIVIAAELFNTAIEQIVQVLHPAEEPRLGRALDMAAGAVLVLAVAAAAVGTITLLPPLWQAVVGMTFD